MQYRVAWIDITKGIAIFLMVCGHTSIPKSVSDFIWSFHMPLFFIVSGMLYKKEKADNYIRFFLNKVRTLVIPYFFFLLCDYLYSIGWNLEVSGRMLTDGIQVGAYWFLQVLFVVEIINAFLIKVLFNNGNVFIRRIFYLAIILIMALLGYWACLDAVHFPYRLEVVGLASLHFGLGFLFKEKICEYKMKKWLSLLMIVIVFISSQFLPRLDMNSNQFGSFIPNIMLAWLGTIVVMMNSKYIEDWKQSNFVKRFLKWTGQYSIVIMGLSQPINMSLKYTLETTQIPRGISVVIQHTTLWLVLFASSYMLCHFAPILIGKKKDSL